MLFLIRKNPLFFALLFPAVVDGVVTLLGQSPQYWSGLGIVNEASPAYYFLLASPWAFILGSIIWFAFWYWAIKHLKEPLNFLVMFIFVIGHSWGSSTWILKMLWEADFYTFGSQISAMTVWAITIVYFIIVAGVASYCLHLYIQSKH